MLRNISWRYFDFWLLGAVVLATAFGTTMIRSAVAQNEVLMPVIDRQIYFALAGLALIFLVATIDYRYWMALYRPIFIVMSLLLFALFLSAQAVFGAARWFSVGVLFLQPTEFAKIAAILLLARYFEKTQNQPRDLRWIAGAFLWVMGLAIWILLQPNLSNVVVLMVILASLLWFNGIRLKHLLLFAVVGFLGIATIVTLSVFGIRIPFLQEYQQQRITNFVLPDPNATFGATYNVQQALIAMIIVIGLGSPQGSVSNLSTSIPVTGGISAFFAALVAALWAYDGWNNVTMVAGEIREPQRNLPRALTFGTLAVVVIYLLTNLAYFYVLPAADVSTSDRVAATMMDRILGAPGAAARTLAPCPAASGSGPGPACARAAPASRTCPAVPAAAPAAGAASPDAADR